MSRFTPLRIDHSGWYILMDNSDMLDVYCRKHSRPVDVINNSTTGNPVTKIDLIEWVNEYGDTTYRNECKYHG